MPRLSRPIAAIMLVAALGCGDDDGPADAGDTDAATADAGGDDAGASPECDPACTGTETCCPTAPGSTDSACVDTATSQSNCGACNTGCPISFACVDGECQSR